MRSDRCLTVICFRFWDAINPPAVTIDMKSLRTTLETGGNHDLTADEFLAYLVDAEWEDRYNRKLKCLLKQARFRYQVSIEEIDLSLKRNLSKQQLLRLVECRWIEQHQDIVITGPTGSGKSYLASALGHRACVNGYKTQYHACQKLFFQLRHARADGNIPEGNDQTAESRPDGH